jgi:diguanylate cyclase (GGDEF)-like protein
MPSFIRPGERRARVLVVDDQSVNLRLAHQILAADCEVLIATSGEQAIALCRTALPDLILLDVQMPGISGLDVCRRLRQDADTMHIPVIFVTAGVLAEDENACWDAGGADFIHKPLNPLTLQHRVNAHLQFKFSVDALRAMAFADGLTGIANRRFFDERLQAEWLRCRRNRLALAVLMIDVDFFKRYNDSYGHQAGDQCLKQVAAALRSGLGRPFDLAARFGGEEFVCLLPETDADGAFAIATRLEAGIRALAIAHCDSSVAPILTISIGVAAMPPDLEDGCDVLVRHADGALYQAKQLGRGRVCIYRPMDDSQEAISAATP